jgi:tetratricopeptide (TPR) repeat protein
LSDSLRNTVSDSLLKKADGMFLWVKLMFDELKRAATDEETMQRLDDLPHGLEEAYRHILHRLLTTIDKRQVESVRILLSLVITCGRPLETEELRWAYAMMVKPASESSIERCLLRLPPDQIIDICGGLLIFNGSVFDVIHSSARDFLSRPVEYWSDIESQRISIFRVLSGDSHAALSDACLSYLMDVECGQLPWEDVTSLNDLQSPPPLLRYACSYAAYHMNRSEISANQMMGKVRKVLESEQFFFAIEYLLMIVITDSSLQLHIEAFILIRTLCLANGGIGELLNAFTTRWEHEYSMRVTRFGQFDPRTQRCIASRDSLLSLRSFDSSLLMFGTPLEAHEESSESGKDADVGLHVTTSPAVLASQPSKLLIVRESLRPKQSRNISEVRGQAADSTRPGFEHLEDLLRASHDISLGRQFQVFARLINQMATVRKVIDPLKSLWQYIKNRATSMPVLLLAAAARYYMGFDKDEECLELCNICLARLTDQDVILKTYIDHLVGYTHRHLGNYDKAIQHLLAALPIEEELLGNSHILLQELRLSLAWSYSAIEKDEQNLQILDDILREGFDDNPRSSVLNRSSSISESAQGVVHHSGFTTRQLRKGFRYYYQSRKLHDTYDIRLKRLEIGAHYDRGEVISSLKGVEEALPDLEKCLDIGYGIPETSRTQAIILDMLLAHLSIGRCQRDKNQDEEVLATVRQIQELRKMHKETLYAADEANLNLLCGYGLNVNIRRLKVSDQSAKDALQDSIASVCKTFGAVDCAEEIDIWYEVAYTKLVGDVEDNPGTSVEIISIYRRFLDSYSELHAKEPLRTLHRKPKLYIAYYRLGHLYDKAGLDLDAVEAWKICLQICGDLWTSTSDAELFSYFVMGWHRLSSSYCFLQRYSESFKAAQKALNLAEGYPEMHEHLVYTIDKFRDNLVRACDRLSKYGTIFAPDGNSLDEGSGYEASSCDDSDDDLSSNNSCHVFNELHCGE